MGPALPKPQAFAAPLSVPRRGRLLVAVLVGHGLLLWLVSTALHPPGPHTVSRAFLPVTVQLVARPLAVTRAALQDPPAPAPRPPAASPLKPELKLAPTFTAPATLAPPPAPAADTSPSTSTMTSPGVDTTRQAPPTPPPLDLTLPPLRRVPEPYSPAHQAVEAQIGRRFANTPESRLARRLQTEWTVENLGDGRVRMRRGDACVMLSATQASQLDPWNNRGTTPRNGGPCGGD